MKTSICVPSHASMLNCCAAEPKTCTKMVNMTVAIAEAPMAKMATMKVIIVKGRARRRTNVLRRWAWLGWVVLVCGGREETANGARKIIRKERTVAAM